MATLATIAPFGFDAFKPPTLLPLYHRLGCRTAQFYRNPDAVVDVESARQVAEDAGLPFDSVHGLFGPDLDPSSPDEAIRRHSIQVYREEAELALHLGGPQVVVHPAPIRPSDIRGPDQIVSRRRALEHSAEELAMAGEQEGVTFLLENLPGNYLFGFDPAGIVEVVRQVGHPRLRMCFDTGHAHMTAGAAASLEACADAVTYMHINDNDGKQDSHWVPGEGTLPWDTLGPLMRRLSPNLPAMLELFETEAEIERHIEAGLGERLGRWLGSCGA